MNQIRDYYSKTIEAKEINLPLKNPTALSGCAHRKHPHLREPAKESKVSAEPPILGGHIWNTSKYPECLNSLIKES